MRRLVKFMTKEPITAEPEEDVASVARRMSEANVGAVFLVSGTRAVGVFTERDLLTRVIAKGHDPARTRVGDVATHDVVTVSDDTSLRQCAEKLRQHGIRHLPVHGAEGVVGVVSARDFFQAVSHEMESLLERRAYEAELREGFDPYDHVGGGYDR